MWCWSKGGRRFTLNLYSCRCHMLHAMIPVATNHFDSSWNQWPKSKPPSIRILATVIMIFFAIQAKAKVISFVDRSIGYRIQIPKILHVNIYLTYQLWIYGKLSKPTNQPKHYQKRSCYFRMNITSGWILCALCVMCTSMLYYATQKIACDLKSFAFVHDPKSMCCVYP